MSIYFVHCNICGQMPEPEVKYFVASCGHLACNNCVGKGLMNVCYICKKAVKVSKVDKDMDPKIKKYFMDPVVMLNQLVADATRVANDYKVAEENLRKENHSLQRELSGLQNVAERSRRAYDRMDHQELLHSSLNLSMDTRKNVSFAESVDVPKNTIVPERESTKRKRPLDTDYQQPGNKGLSMDQESQIHQQAEHETIKRTARMVGRSTPVSQAVSTQQRTPQSSLPASDSAKSTPGNVSQGLRTPAQNTSHQSDYDVNSSNQSVKSKASSNNSSASSGLDLRTSAKRTSAKRKKLSIVELLSNSAASRLPPSAQKVSPSVFRCQRN